MKGARAAAEAQASVDDAAGLADELELDFQRLCAIAETLSDLVSKVLPMRSGEQRTWMEHVLLEVLEDDGARLRRDIARLRRMLAGLKAGSTAAAAGTAS